MDFETIATYTKVIQRLSSVEVISFLLRATCVICERAKCLPSLRAKASLIKMDGRYGNENAIFVRLAELLLFQVWCPVPHCV